MNEIETPKVEIGEEEMFEVEQMPFFYARALAHYQ